MESIDLDYTFILVHIPCITPDLILILISMTLICQVAQKNCISKKKKIEKIDGYMD
jgi:hypothetical protein